MLGTPPAFILSQDQTLMFKCLIYSSFCLANPRFTLLGIRFWSKHVLILKIFFKMWFTSFIRIFRVVLLFNYQASLKRSRLFLTDSFLRQRDIYYHAFSKLSTLFLSFFIFLQTLVFRPFCRKDSQSGNQTSVVLSTTFERKKTQYDVTHCVTEKEGFEPSRRANDLHP